MSVFRRNVIRTRPHKYISFFISVGGKPRVVVSTAAFHARVRGSFPGLGGLKEAKRFLPHILVKLSIVGSLRDLEVVCSAPDLQGLTFESCVWRAVSSHSSHHPHMARKETALVDYAAGQSKTAVGSIYSLYKRAGTAV